MNRGLTHVYCGDGKGKTTAAIGLGVRACGRGMRVLMAQFLKGKNTGELAALENLAHFSVVEGPGTLKYAVDMSAGQREEYRALAEEMLDVAVKSAVNGQCDMLILDEIFAAVSEKMIDEKTVINFLKTRPEGLEIVLTGRNPTKGILDLADYISEIRKLRHPYDAGVKSRLGIEY